VLVRRLEKVADVGESDDLVELRIYLRTPHAVQPCGQIHVVAHGEIVDEAASDLDERGDAAGDLDGALIGDHDARDELQQCGLALTVAADHADRLARPHVDRHVAQRPEFVRTGATSAPGEEVLERTAAASVATEADAESVRADRGVGRLDRGGRGIRHQISFST
jgi:hypothetical protein